MSNIWEKVTYLKLQFSKFKKFVSSSVFGGLQLTQISLNFKTFCNLEIRGLGAKLCVVFLILWFWKELWCFKVKESMPILLNKNINFNKNETESKMENPTHSFSVANHVLQLIYESWIVMSWSSRKKKEGILCNVYFIRRTCF